LYLFCQVKCHWCHVMVRSATSTVSWSPRKLFWKLDLVLLLERAMCSGLTTQNRVSVGFKLLSYWLICNKNYNNNSKNNNNNIRTMFMMLTSRLKSLMCGSTLFRGRFIIYIQTVCYTFLLDNCMFISIIAKVLFLWYSDV